MSQALAELFARRRHTVGVLTMGYSDLPEREKKNDVTLRRTRVKRKLKTTCDTREMAAYVAESLISATRMLKRENYDIIHCHCAVPTGLLAYASTRITKVPYVITAHGSDIPGYNPDRFKLEHRISHHLLRPILRNAAALTAPSRFLCGLARDRIGPLEIVHIPNGVHVDQFVERRKERRLLMSGRFLPRKGFQHVLRALRDLDTDYEVHIAGDGPLRGELERLAEELTMKVFFHGWLDHDSAELRELYETSSILCLFSEKENASMALLEGMMAGMTVVVSDSSGCPEIAGDAGVLIPPGDTDGLRKALRKLLKSEKLIHEYGTRARRRVMEKFDWEVIGTRYLDLFERVIASPK